MHHVDIKCFNQCYKQLVFNTILKLLWKNSSHDVGSLFLVTWSSSFLWQIWGVWWENTEAASCWWKIHKAWELFSTNQRNDLYATNLSRSAGHSGGEENYCLASEGNESYLCSPTIPNSNEGSALKNRGLGGSLLIHWSFCLIYFWLFCIILCKISLAQYFVSQLMVKIEINMIKRIYRALLLSLAVLAEFALIWITNMKIHEITEVVCYYLQEKKRKRKNTLAIHFKNKNKTKIIELMSYYDAVNHKQIIWAVQHKVQ